MTVTSPTSVQDAGLRELRDVARLMRAHRDDERVQLLAAMDKAKERLVDPHAVLGVFAEEDIDVFDLRAVLDG